jgi:hypothetical protein
MRALYAMLFDRMPSTWALEKVGHQTHSSHRRCIHVWACPLERSSLGSADRVVGAEFRGAQSQGSGSRALALSARVMATY